MVRKKGEYKIIQRRYPESDWDYKAVSVLVEDSGKKKDVVYGIVKTAGKTSTAVEIYSGSNYIVGSDDSSYSKKYEVKDVPRKYDHIVEMLINQHLKQEWSDEEKVDSN